VLSATDAGVRLRRYWTLPVEEEIRYRQEGDYVERFRELLGLAVHDRLRAPRAALMMSGGLDSSSVAATARGAAPSSQGNLKAVTLVYERLIPDDERQYSGLVAQALNLPIQYVAVDGYNLFDGWEDAQARPSEPFSEWLLAIQDDALRLASAFSRTVLTGQGGDPALSTSITHHARSLLKGLQLARLLRDFGRFALAEGRFSRLYFDTRWRVFRTRRARPGGRPAWLAPEFSARFPYEERLSQISEVASSKHPLRPHAYQVLTSPLWPYQFALYDPGTTRVPVECRHPYFDLRLVRFLLRVPPVPWCTDKEIVRRALRGILPDSVRLRRKSPLTQDVVPLLLRRPDHWWRDVRPAPGIENYVQWQLLPHQTAAESSGAATAYLSAVGLNLWLMAQSAKAGLASRGEMTACIRPLPLETAG
jgi:asparagine synthase (glutamine-hydrolysing)